MSPERQALADISARLPGEAVAYGIDRKGPWATVGGVTHRARTPAAALIAALQKHGNAT